MARGTVVVTGASSGIGDATARRLRDDGFEVFAAVRKDEDAERLSVLRVRPVKLDVTDPASIARAALEVTQHVGGRGLAALVNNAGIAISGPLEHMPIDEFRNQLEVNLVGQVAVTQAFLPLLRRAGGRIVNVSSIGGRIALPLMSPYAASKFGLEAVSDSLRRELRPQGIAVIVVEPGGVKTEIWGKGTETAARLEAGMPPDADTHYGSIGDALRRESQKIATKTGLPPSEVADTISEALTTEKPRTRYMVGRDARLRWAIAKRVPDRWFDALIGRALR